VLLAGVSVRPGSGKDVLLLPLCCPPDPKKTPGRRKAPGVKRDEE
jgi:hypothetical protein